MQDDTQHSFRVIGTNHPFQPEVDPDTRGTPLHAMTLVGVRDVEDHGTKLFFVQTWWVKKQLLEVDCAYLWHFGAEASYITPRTFTAWATTHPTTCYRVCLGRQGDVRAEGKLEVPFCANSVL
jgi:hypothetical protein